MEEHPSEMAEGEHAFARALRFLHRDGFRRAALGLLALAGVLLLIWCGWFFFGEVAVIASTESARIEVEQAAHSIEAPVAGKVVANQMHLDLVVTAGQVLLVLDAEAERLQIVEKQAHLAALAAEIEALRQVLAAHTKARNATDRAGREARAEAQKKSRSARAQARQAKREAERVRRLAEVGALSEAEALKTRTEAASRKADEESMRLSVFRRKWERRSRLWENEVRISKLQSEIARIEGDMVTLRATIRLLEHEVELRTIRAPVAGRIAEVADLPVGSVLAQGAKLGALVPPGKLRVVALFSPPAALGRVRKGQMAQLRLHGFSWIQYGSLQAQVARVASEVRNGKVRVELKLISLPKHSAIPLQHGLPGAVEVEVERITPAALALRAAGKLVSSPAAR